ncbi:MAG: lipopolysaccharide biosynthesis protein [Bacteroidales bacterium]|nr:lipopolysaccharide biosynthesis protein [Bacteroidales bacterium]MDD3989173.1 lipopolysaccharide biosynthesis protein [Bacteroidales bacterium]
MRSEKQQLIAKNTGMLYIRMLFTMLISLYTSKVVLATIGIEDYGIYNVVGGVVTMFSFLSNAMLSGTQRFLSFELGRDDMVQLKKVFGMSVNIHVIIAVIVLIVAETVSLWFVNTQLTIPGERISAANWVYQFSVLSFVLVIVSVPYTATIVAHEKMNVFAYVSILEVSLKLGIVFMLQLSGYDKLKFYAVLGFLVTLLVQSTYVLYCRKSFKEAVYSRFWDKALYKTLISYAGWNLWGNIAAVMMNQGVNILLNIFFGPVVNAARGIAYQVNGAVNGFVSNFQLAMNPQIVKSYAAGDNDYMHQLIFKGAKYSFFLLYVLCLPIIMETEMVLSIWLKNVPDYTALFCRLVLVATLINCVSGPLMTAAQASGKIKLYQAAVGGLLILILPVSYIFLKWGYPPHSVFYVTIGFYIIALLARLLIISPLVNLSIRKFTTEVILRALAVVLVTAGIPLLFKHFTDHNVIRFIVVVVISLLSSATGVLWIGMKREERVSLWSGLKNIMLNVRKRGNG